MQQQGTSSCKLCYDLIALVARFALTLMSVSAIAVSILRQRCIACRPGYDFPEQMKMA